MKVASTLYHVIRMNQRRFLVGFVQDIAIMLELPQTLASSQFGQFCFQAELLTGASCNRCLPPINQTISLIPNVGEDVISRNSDFWWLTKG